MLVEDADVIVEILGELLLWQGCEFNEDFVDKDREEVLEGALAELLLGQRSRDECDRALRAPGACGQLWLVHSALLDAELLAEK